MAATQQQEKPTSEAAVTVIIATGSLDEQVSASGVERKAIDHVRLMSETSAELPVDVRGPAISQAEKSTRASESRKGLDEMVRKVVQTTEVQLPAVASNHRLLESRISSSTSNGATGEDSCGVADHYEEEVEGQSGRSADRASSQTNGDTLPTRSLVASGSVPSHDSNATATRDGQEEDGSKSRAEVGLATSRNGEPEDRDREHGNGVHHTDGDEWARKSCEKIEAANSVAEECLMQARQNCPSLSIVDSEEEQPSRFMPTLLRNHDTKDRGQESNKIETKDDKWEEHREDMDDKNSENASLRGESVHSRWSLPDGGGLSALREQRAVRERFGDDGEDDESVDQSLNSRAEGDRAGSARSMSPRSRVGSYDLEDNKVGHFPFDVVVVSPPNTTRRPVKATQSVACERLAHVLRLATLVHAIITR